MKKLRLLAATALISLSMSITALAGSWQSDSKRWWYQNDDGSYPVSTWQWIDGNGDGISEKYYFDSEGYCLTDTVTPDGNIVNEKGALVVNNKVQTQTAAVPEVSVPKEDTSTPVSATVWLSRTGKKYHSNPSCSNMKNPIKATLDDAIAQGRTACSKCY